MGFINSIPIWLYIVIAVVGLAIGILCIVLSGQARRRPGGGGGGALTLGILSLVVLTVAPLVLMTIGLTSGPSRPSPVASSSSTGGTTSSTGGFASSGSTGGSTGGFSSTGGDGTTSSSTSSSGGSTSSGGNAVLAAALSQAVQQMRARLPMNSGPTTITDIEAEGTTLVMTVSINQPIGGQWAAVDAGFRSSMCSGQFGALINQGASLRVDMTDSGGDSHTTELTSC
jgi:hypothetical protein